MTKVNLKHDNYHVFRANQIALNPKERSSFSENSIYSLFHIRIFFNRWGMVRFNSCIDD